MKHPPLPTHVACPTCNGSFLIETSGQWRQMQTHLRACAGKTAAKQPKPAAQRNRRRQHP